MPEVSARKPRELSAKEIARAKPANTAWAWPALGFGFLCFAALAYADQRAAIKSAILNSNRPQWEKLMEATLKSGAPPMMAGCAIHIAMPSLRDEWKRETCTEEQRRGWSAERLTLATHPTPVRRPEEQ